MTNCKVGNFPRSMWRQLAIAGNIELRVLGDKFKTEDGAMSSRLMVRTSACLISLHNIPLVSEDI